MSEALAHTTQPSSGWTELTRQSLYRVSGKDPYRFLHGQLTQSMDEVDESQARRAAVCTPKGRAYGLMMVARLEDDYLLTLPDSTAEETTSQLNKYLMLFRGTEMSRLEQGRIFGLWGKTPASDLTDPSALQQPGDAVSVAGGKLIRAEDTAEGTPRYEFWSPDGTCPFETESGASEDDWQASEISAGVAHLEPETISKHVPQTLNWQHLNGIHFRKGCYTGQEVIARMHYLGQQKKSLFRLQVKAEAPAPATSIQAGDSTIGEVVNSIGFEDGRAEMLAIVKHTALKQPEWTLAGNGEALSIMPMSYQVPEHSDEHGESGSH